MNLRMLLSVLFVLVLLCGCGPVQDPTVGPTGPVVNPTTAPTTVPTTAPTTVPTEPTTEPTEVYDPFAFGYFDEIYVHPFTQDDMTTVLADLNTALSATKDQEGVLDFQVHWVSFDPYYTGQVVDAQIQSAPVDGWTPADYYARKMVFVVNFTISHDHTVSVAEDYTEQSGIVTMTRENTDSPWQIDATNCAPAVISEPSSMVIPPEMLENLALTDKFVLAGYRDEPVGEYFLYVLDPDTNIVVCHSYTAAKPN